MHRNRATWQFPHGFPVAALQPWPINHDRQGLLDALEVHLPLLDAALPGAFAQLAVGWVRRLRPRHLRVRSRADAIGTAARCADLRCHTSSLHSSLAPPRPLLRRRSRSEGHGTRSGSSSTGMNATSSTDMGGSSAYAYIGPLQGTRIGSSPTLAASPEPAAAWPPAASAFRSIRYCRTLEYVGIVATAGAGACEAGSLTKDSGWSRALMGAEERQTTYT